MTRPMQGEQPRRGWGAAPGRDLLGHQLSQGHRRRLKLERFLSSRHGTGTTGEQVPTQAPHKGSTSDQIKGLKKTQQRPCKLLLFVSAVTRTEHFFRVLFKLCEFKGLTLVQLEKQRTGLSLRRSRGKTTGLQDAAFRDQAVKNLHTRRVVESHQQAPQHCSEHTSAQGTRAQHSTWVNSQTEGREERKVHSTWLRLHNSCFNCWSSLRSQDDRCSRSVCFY